jgi:hypothetical protein
VQSTIRARPGEQELGQAAVALAPAGHCEALAPAVLALDPRARAALPVAHIEPFCHHALETLLRGDGQQLLDVADEVPGRPPRWPLELEHVAYSA